VSRARHSILGRWPVLAAGEGANLVRPELLDSETGDPSVVETTACGGGLLQPASDGVPANPLDPSNRANADALNSESDDRVERSSSMLEAVVGRAFGRRERQTLRKIHEYFGANSLCG